MKFGSANGRQAGVLFALIFLYALCAGIFIQLVALPILMPSLHAGHGLLKGGDWVWFYSDAVALANRIQHEGWQIWEFRPINNAPIGVAAAVFAVTGIYEPWILLPLNAALFAIGGLCLYRIFNHLASQRQAWIATLPYVLFPSAAMIYGHIHKDVFSIAGVLLVFLAWVEIARESQINWRTILRWIVLVVLGSFLVWLVRPYLILPLLAASFLAAVLLGALIGRMRAKSWWLGILLCLIVQGVFVRFSFVPTAPSTSSTSSTSSVAAYLQSAVDALNNKRTGFAQGSPHAGSNIDTEVRFNVLGDIVDYLPRSLQVGLLAPFPSMWFSEGVSPGSGAMRSIVGLEMAVSYILLLGIFFLILGDERENPALWTILLLTFVVLLALALVICNVGTLYRMRYGVWQVLLGLGIIGWLHVFNSSDRKTKN